MRSRCGSSASYTTALRQAGEDAEGRPAERKLEELGVDAAELVGPVLVARLDLGVAHRERVARRADGAEPGAPRLGRLEHLEVDLDAVDLLHAADVGMPVILVCVDERTRAGEASGRIDDLVAVNAAASALDLVLRPERKLGRGLELAL